MLRINNHWRKSLIIAVILLINFMVQLFDTTQM